jgi:hypothetical protein
VLKIIARTKTIVFPTISQGLTSGAPMPKIRSDRVGAGMIIQRLKNKPIVLNNRRRSGRLAAIG